MATGDWFFNNVSITSIAINPIANTPSILSFNNPISDSFGVRVTPNCTTIGDVAGIAFDIASDQSQYNLLTATYASTVVGVSATFTIALSKYISSTLTSLLTASVTVSAQTLAQNLNIKFMRTGMYVGAWVNNTAINLGSSSALGETVQVPPMVSSNLVVFDGITPFTNSIGLYASSAGGTPPAGQTDQVTFRNIQIYDQNRNSNLDYFINDVASLGGVMKYSGEILYQNNFTDLNLWQ